MIQILLFGLTFFSVFGLVWIIKCIRTVPHNTVAIVERFGKYSKTLTSGLNILSLFDTIKSVKWDFYEATHHTGNSATSRKSVNHTYIPLYTMTIDVPPVMSRSNDNLEISIDSSIRYHIIDPVKAVYESSNPLGYIQDVIVESIRDVCSTVDAATIQNNVNVFNTVLNRVNDKVKRCGIECTSFIVQEIRMSEKIRRSKEDNYAKIKEAEVNGFILAQEHQAKIQKLTNELEQQELEQKKANDALTKELERQHMVSKMHTKIFNEQLALQNKRITELIEKGFNHEQIVKIMSDEAWSTSFRDTKVHSLGYIPNMNNSWYGQSLN